MKYLYLSMLVLLFVVFMVASAAIGLMMAMEGASALGVFGLGSCFIASLQTLNVIVKELKL